MKKTAVSLLLIFLMVFSAGCAAQAIAPQSTVSADTSSSPVIGADTKVLTYANNSRISSTFSQSMYDASGGKIWLKTYGDSIMGTDVEILKGVQLGTIDMISSTPASQYTVVPEAALLDIPFVFDSVEEATDYLQNVLIDWLQPYYNKAGLQIIAGYVPAFRNLTSNREIKSVRDLKGLRLRTVDNVYHQTFWSYLGAEIYVMDYDKLYYTLRNNMLDAQDNSIYLTGRDEDFIKIQPYVLEANHIPFFMLYIINKDVYDGLPPETREGLINAFKVRAQSLTENALKNAGTALKESGMTVTTPDKALMSEMKESAALIIEKLKEDIGEDIVNEYLELVNYKP